MNSARIRETPANCFKPIALRLSHGRRAVAPYPDAVAISRHVVMVVDKHQRVSIIDPLRVVSIKERVGRT
jgi:hypothetical protein